MFTARGVPGRRRCTHHYAGCRCHVSSNASIVNPQMLLRTRFWFGTGWVIHGIVIESELTQGIGSIGKLLNNDCSEVGEWRGDRRGKLRNFNKYNYGDRCNTNIKQISRGDYIVHIEGHGLNRSVGTRYLCYDIRFVFASTLEIYQCGKHESWKGEPFSFDIDQPGLLSALDFHDGTLRSIQVQKTTLHCVLSYQRARLLPTDIKQRLLEMLRIGSQFRCGVLRHLPSHLWWKVLEFFMPYNILEDSQSPEGKQEKPSKSNEKNGATVHDTMKEVVDIDVVVEGNDGSNRRVGNSSNGVKGCCVLS